MNTDLIKGLLSDFFLYSPETPFLFTRLMFWLFFLLVLAVDLFIYKNKPLRSAFIFGVSVFFYYKTSGLFFLLLLFSITMDYNFSKIIHRSTHKNLRLILASISVIVNLSILGFFKYAYFFTESYNALFDGQLEVINHLAVFGNNMLQQEFWDIDKIVLPVGVSFYTFQTLSYTLDVYKGKLEPAKRFIDFGFYVSFFPQLVAGPIVRATEFLPQLYAPYSLSKKAFGISLFWILNGLVKKLFIGDYLAVNFIDRVFANPSMYTGFESFMSIILYSLQVYTDFSGYTDIAIGIAGLMGFTLTQNFNSPYKARNVGDFWRRWHISLSTWLRDYLYIPLGGNRIATKGTFIWLCIIGFFVGVLSIQYFQEFFQLERYRFADIVMVSCVVMIGLFAPLALLIYALGSKNAKETVTTEINSMITMLVGGLWHGPSWNFVIWGGLNGLGLVVYKRWKKITPLKGNSLFERAWGIFVTFLFISLTRIFFRSADAQKSRIGEKAEGLINTPEMNTAKDMLNKMWYEFDLHLAPQILEAYWKVFFIFALGMIIHWLPADFKEAYRNRFAAFPPAVQVVLSVLVVFIVYQSVSGELQPFIYFQF